MKYLATFVILFYIAVAIPFPKQALLHAPYTNFQNDTMRTLNLSSVEGQAKLAHDFGVNLIWVPGGMGQFVTMTQKERELLLEEWVKFGHQNNHYIVAHVGSTVLEESIELAIHAKSVGADGIGSVPPYYETTGVDGVIEWFQQISAAVPDMDLFYYHIPGSTNTNIKILELLQKAIDQQKLPKLRGIKYVSSDMWDFFHCLTQYGDKIAMMFAPEPKLAGLGLGSSHAVLAEDFYAQTYQRMYDAFKKGDMQTAQWEQNWKDQVDSIFGKYPGNAKRDVYLKFANIDIGVPRLPDQPQNPSLREQLYAELEQFQFFERAYPINQTNIKI